MEQALAKSKKEISDDFSIDFSCGSTLFINGSKS
jgi:hypothetical protein